MFTLSYFQMLLCGVLCAVFFVISRRKARTNRLIDALPGPPGLPLVGNAVEINVEHDELFQRLTGGTQMFGRTLGMFKSWLGTSPYVFLFSAPLVEVILSSTKHIDKSADYDYLRPWLGTGLLTSWGPKWRARRKALTPSFHFKILEDFVGVFQEQSDVLTARLALQVGQGGFDLFPLVTLCTLDIICETAMGRQVNAQGNSDSEYVRAIYEISSIIQTRQSKIWLQPDWLFRLSKLFRTHQKCISMLHGFSNRVIRERRAERRARRLEGTAEEGRKRLAFLDLLIEASQDGAAMTDEDIREEVDTFMFEGHDTTSAAVCWTLYLISSDPEVERKVLEEQDSIFGGSDRPLTMADLQCMKYLECCIKEALRLYPSVPIMARRLDQDVQLGDHTIPRGTTAMILTYMLHRDSRSFPYPEQFKPERFAAGGMQGRHPFAYIPFSAGPRNCIGQKFAMLEEKTVVSSVLRRYRLEPLQRREDLTLLGELILRPKGGLHFRIFER